MKIRHGFVTNSSSTSFVLAFDSHKVLDVLLKDPMVPPEIAKMLAQRIESTPAISRKKLKELLFMGFERKYRLKLLFESSYEEYSRKLDEKELTEIERQTQEILDKTEGKTFVLLFEQDDHSETGSMLEQYILPNMKNTFAVFCNH